MIFRPDAGGLLTVKRTRTLENFRLVLRPNVLLRPNGFSVTVVVLRSTTVTSRIAGCLPPVLVGGSTVNSSSQILVNSTGEPLSAAGPCRVVAWLTRSHCAPVSPRDSDLSQSGGGPEPYDSFRVQCCFTSNLGFREIQVQVDVQTSDVMAGAGGGEGPAPDVRHQPG
jgi:hypothetical protein